MRLYGEKMNVERCRWLHLKRDWKKTHSGSGDSIQSGLLVLLRRGDAFGSS